jgi:hypothetical protein
MTDQLAFTFSPPRARRTDPKTSHGAAVIAITRSEQNRRDALAALRAVGERGYNDFELAVVTGIPQTSIGCRRGQLCKAGLVVPLMVRTEKGWVQHTRPSTTTGSPSGVYIAAEFETDPRPAE